jgi:tetratricopeptide (TPR) repeat protein
MKVNDREPISWASKAGMRKAIGIIVILLGLLALVYVAWSMKRPERTEKTAGENDALGNLDSPYRNVRPDVLYVGDEACARCHADEAAAYRKHPMSHSLAPVSLAVPLERYDSASHNPFDAQKFHYEAERRGQQIFHRETRLDEQGKVLTETKVDVQFALGSGARGRSYLVNHDGYLFQSPISWFTQEKRWDLAPGYEAKNNHFSRPISARCLFCHANRAKAVPDTINRYRMPIFQGYAIGCERCHGPGELHVRERGNGAEVKNGLDDTIVNPARLDPVLREGVCQQCHLQGQYSIEKRNRPLADYRPGLPLHAFVSVYVLRAQRLNQKKAVGHVEQMYASRCFQGSRQELGCISCHDPHFYPEPAEKIDYYRQRCLTCHDSQGCKLPVDVRRSKSKEDSCIECHMPRFSTSDVAHTASTNHRIPRFAGKETSFAARSTSEEYPLVNFPPEVNSSDEGKDRDLGIALAEAARSYHETQPASQALKLLEPALQRHPDDVLAWEAKGTALELQGQPEEALKAYARALDLHPVRENSLTKAAVLAIQSQQPRAAIDYLQRAVAVNPWNWQAFNQLAVLLAGRQEWKSAAEQCRKALALHPTDLETRKLLVQCYLRLGDQTRAKAEMDIVRSLDPDSEPLPGSGN